MESSSSNGWHEWSKYVLKELERLNDEQEKINKKIDKLIERLIKVERVAWVIGGAFALMTPVIIWGIISLIEWVTGL